MTREEIKKDPKLFADVAAERKERYEENMKLVLPTLLRRDSVIRLTTMHMRGEKALGTPVSAGEVTARLVYVTSLEVDPLDIKDAIAVFADASPAYSNVYRHAKGIIFQAGGAMSHGAIVAREYRIPAISLGGHSLEWEPNSTVTLNGTDGSVTLI